MKRLILFLFILSLFFSCETEVKETEKTPNYSSFIISFVHRDSFKMEGYDADRGAYIITAPDTALVKDILNKYPLNLTEFDKVKCFYEFFDSAKVNVKAVRYDRSIKKLF